MRLVLSFLAAALIATGAAGAPNEIGFGDLPDPAARDFEDPFRAMGTENLMELKTVVRLRERLAGDDVLPEARPRLEARVAEASAALAAKGYDVEALLGQRWEIAEKRRRAMLATNPALDGQEVELSGYLIPGQADEDGTPTGYLVSTVGLCSHFPPPPPNQLVRVRLHETDVPQRSTLYTPVQFAGTLHAEPSDETVFVLDGEVRMIGRWTLDAREAVIDADASAGSTMTNWRHPLLGSVAQPVGNGAN